MRLTRQFDGECIHVERDGRTWWWARCVFCRRPLREQASRAVGVGPECARRHTGIEITERVAQVLASDRQRYRDRLDVERILQRPGRIREGVWS